MEEPTIKTFVAISEAQIEATRAQTEVLKDIKNYLERQKESMDRYEASVVQQLERMDDLEKDLNNGFKNTVIEKIDMGHKEIHEKIKGLEFASRLHWFIVGGGFLGLICTIVAAVLHK